MVNMIGLVLWIRAYIVMCACVPKWNSDKTVHVRLIWWATSVCNAKSTCHDKSPYCKNWSEKVTISIGDLFGVVIVTVTIKMAQWPLQVECLDFTELAINDNYCECNTINDIKCHDGQYLTFSYKMHLCFTFYPLYISHDVFISFL